MRKMVAVGVILAAIAVSGAPRAQAESGVSTVASEGAMSCPTVLSINAQNPRSAKTIFMAWAQGFMTSFNFTRVNILHVPAVNLEGSAFPTSAQWAYLLNYCQEDHTARFIDAVITLMGAVQRAK